MSKTPFVKITSEDILSAHINGLGNAINNIETVLDMQTKIISDNRLDPVTDMENVNDRYRIYEGTVRCWLTSPAPIIKRNGTVVQSSEYIIQPAYGVVVFHSPQKAGDNITVSATVINSVSGKINEIEEAIDTVEQSTTQNSTSISSINKDIKTMKDDITTLKNKPSGGGSAPKELSVNIGVKAKTLTNSSNNCIPPEDSDAWIVGEGILIPSGVYEAFPFIIEQHCRVSQIEIENTTLSGGGVFVRACIYKADPVTGNPKTYVARSKDYRDLDKETGLKYLTFDTNLEPGLYYIAMYYSGSAFMRGMRNEYCLGLNVGDNNKSKINNSDGWPKIGSVRTAAGQPTNFPENTDFPAIQYYCGREATASPIIKIVEQM